MKYKDENGNWIELHVKSYVPLIDENGTPSDTNTYNANAINKLVKDVYSEKEQVIGTWLGKPLYRKVYVINHTGTTDITVNDIDFDTAYINGNSFFINDVYHIKYGYASSANTDWSRAYIKKDSRQIFLELGTTYSNKELTSYVIIEYTKTTD